MVILELISYTGPTELRILFLKKFLFCLPPYKAEKSISFLEKNVPENIKFFKGGLI